MNVPLAFHVGGLVMFKGTAFRLVALTTAAVMAGACASQPEPSQVALVMPPAIFAPAQAEETAKHLPPRPARAALPAPTKTALLPYEGLKPTPPIAAPASASASAERKPESSTKTAEAPVVFPPPIVAAPTPTQSPARNRTSEQPASQPPADAEKAKRFALKEAAVIAAVITASRAAYLGMGKPCACPDNVMRNGQACGMRSAHSRPGGFKPLCYPTDVSAPVINHWRATGAIPPI
jgi:hypothetical protein